MVKASMIAKVDANMKIVVFYDCPKKMEVRIKPVKKIRMSQAVWRSQMEHMNSDKILEGGNLSRADA